MVLGSGSFQLHLITVALILQDMSTWAAVLMAAVLINLVSATSPPWGNTVLAVHYTTKVSITALNCFSKVYTFIRVCKERLSLLDAMVSIWILGISHLRISHLRFRINWCFYIRPRKSIICSPRHDLIVQTDSSKGKKHIYETIRYKNIYCWIILIWKSYEYNLSDLEYLSKMGVK